MVNWHFLIRLGWIIPLCILVFFFIFALVLFIFIDEFIDFYIYKSITAKTETEKKLYSDTLFQLMEIKLNLIKIKMYLKRIFKK